LIAREKRQKEREAERSVKMRERAKVQKEREKILKEKQKLREGRQKEREKKQQQKQKELEEIEKKRETKIKVKEEKDQKPKRTRSPYSYFVKEHMPTYTSQHPDITIGERMAMVAEKWAALSESQKQPYIDMNNQDKKRRETEVKEYEKILPPRRPLSPFLIFSNEHRHQLLTDNPTKKFSELGKMLGDMWRGLSEQQKQEYNAQAEKLKVEYQTKLEKFNSK